MVCLQAEEEDMRHVMSIHGSDDFRVFMDEDLGGMLTAVAFRPTAERGMFGGFRLA